MAQLFRLWRELPASPAFVGWWSGVPAGNGHFVSVRVELTRTPTRFRSPFSESPFSSSSMLLAITMKWRLPAIKVSIKLSSFDTHKTIKQVKRTGTQQNQQDELLSTFFGSSLLKNTHT